MPGEPPLALHQQLSADRRWLGRSCGGKRRSATLVTPRFSYPAQSLPSDYRNGASLSGSSRHPEGIKPTAASRSRRMRARMAANRFVDTVTSAIWKITCRA